MVRFFAVLPAPRMMPIRRVVCWRLKDLAQWIFEDFGISLDETTLGRELNFRKLSARPRHHAQNGNAVEDFKKSLAGELAAIRAKLPPGTDSRP